jgi:hypothetical protein
LSAFISGSFLLQYAYIIAKWEILVNQLKISTRVLPGKQAWETAVL